MNETVIVASNRPPTVPTIGEGNSVQMEWGSGGGLTIALRAAAASRKDTRFICIGSAISEAERIVAGLMRKDGAFYDVENVSPRYIEIPRDQYDMFYEDIANPLLWFLEHLMWDYAREPDVDEEVWHSWTNGYVPVNKAFAQAIIEESRKAPSAPIMNQDYHLLLVGKTVRKALPEARMTHFLHIPWPGALSWRMLPDKMVRGILESLLACNVVGFQTERDKEAFLATCKDFFRTSPLFRGRPRFEVDWENSTVRDRRTNRMTRACVYPISIDVQATRHAAYSAEADGYIEQELKPYFRQHTFVHVGRADPSKNILRMFKAYGRLLARYPRLRKKASFVTFLVPTRDDITGYRNYRDDIEKEVAGINHSFGIRGWEPIKVFWGDNYVRGLAGMRGARGTKTIMVEDSVADGMNLVAIEFVAVNECDDVLIISPTMGVHAKFSGNALSVAPTDVEGLYKAYHRAITMPAAERRERMLALKAIVEANGIDTWLTKQLDDI